MFKKSYLKKPSVHLAMAIGHSIQNRSFFSICCWVASNSTPKFFRHFNSNFRMEETENYQICNKFLKAKKNHYKSKFVFPLKFPFYNINIPLIAIGSPISRIQTCWKIPSQKKPPVHLLANGDGHWHWPFFRIRIFFSFCWVASNFTDAHHQMTLFYVYSSRGILLLTTKVLQFLPNFQIILK